MKKGILLLGLLLSPILIIVFAFGFLILMIFLNADSGDQLDKMYESEEFESTGGAYCSTTGVIDESLWNDFWNGKSANNLQGYGDLVLEHSNLIGIDPVLVTAIMMQESGSGVYTGQNNPGGIMDWDNNFETKRQFDTMEDGIIYVIENLGRRVLDDGLVTVEELGSKYAPIGAENDPLGLNENWVPGVSDFITSLGGLTMNCSSTASIEMGDYTVEIKQGFAWPIPHTKHLTSGVGPRWGKQHKGIDVAWPGISGTPVVSMLDGEVKVVHTGCPVGCLAKQGCGTHTCGGGYGNRVDVQHSDGTYTRYAHLQDVIVQEGQKVKVGQLLGSVGSSGHSSGAHLHFEVRRANETIIDPEILLKGKGYKFTYN